MYEGALYFPFSFQRGQEKHLKRERVDEGREEVQEEEGEEMRRGEMKEEEDGKKGRAEI